MSEENIIKIVNYIQSNTTTSVESLILNLLKSGFSYDECREAISRLGLSPLVLPKATSFTSPLKKFRLLFIGLTGAVFVIIFLSVSYVLLQRKQVQNQLIPPTSPTPLAIASTAPTITPTLTPTEAFVSGKIIFMTKMRSLAVADVKGTSIQPFYNDDLKEVLNNIMQVELSPDKKKVYIATVDDFMSPDPKILNYIIDRGSSTVTPLTTEEITKNIGTYRYVLFSTWTSDSKNLIFEATNDLTGTDASSEKAVGLYDIEDMKVEILFRKNAQFLGEIFYDTEKNMVHYLEGYGSGKAKTYIYDKKNDSHIPVEFSGILKPLSVAPSLETVIAISSSSDVADTRSFSLYTFPFLSDPVANVTLQEPKDFEFLWVPNPIWSADSKTFFFPVRQGVSIPTQKVQFYSYQGKLISSIDVSDFKRSETGSFIGETRPDSGIFSDDGKYFLLSSRLLTSFSDYKWRLIEVSTGNVLSSTEISTELGNPIGWIE